MASAATVSDLPPGIDGDWIHYNSGGGDNYEWLPFALRKQYTNAYVVDKENKRVLLGFKKRGFGKSMYNGFGGKVEPGESRIQAAQRELYEEAGINAELHHAGVLFFVNVGDEVAFHIDIYRANTWTGQPTESDEMRPQWFQISSTPLDTTTITKGPSEHSQSTADSEYPAIPFDEMWETDRYWLPLLLSDIPFYGRADFAYIDDTWVPRRWWYGVPPSHAK
ncbi:hypothetical protein AX16_011014 [Volvariella volvacea WC 439]|nr:hypothetical protein AX16_011014 [Volvariella volvacea WC 439]